MSENGGFLFISHSHHDMDKVRQLRNKLEDEGFEPLCFYLKCLDDTTDELHDLIKREIDARQWFVYAVSPNSKASEYVQWEREWRKRPESKNKQELVWNLESDTSIDEFSEILIECLRVHIICSHKDIGFVNKLRDKLKEKDLQVTTNLDRISGKSWYKEACESSTTFVVLSENSINSMNVIKEVKFALNMGIPILPVFIDDVELKGDLMCMAAIQSIFPEGPIKDEKDLDFLVEKVVDNVKYYLNISF